MKEYKFAYISRHLGKYTLGLKENEQSEIKWLTGTEYTTVKATLSRFKTMYAPLGTKEVIRIKVCDFYDVYEAR